MVQNVLLGLLGQKESHIYYQYQLKDSASSISNLRLFIEKEYYSLFESKFGKGFCFLFSQ